MDLHCDSAFEDSSSDDGHNDNNEEVNNYLELKLLLYKFNNNLKYIIFLKYLIKFVKKYLTYDKHCLNKSQIKHICRQNIKCAIKKEDFIILKQYIINNKKIKQVEKERIIIKINKYLLYNDLFLTPINEQFFSICNKILDLGVSYVMLSNNEKRRTINLFKYFLIYLWLHLEKTTIVYNNMYDNIILLQNIKMYLYSSCEKSSKQFSNNVLKCNKYIILYNYKINLQHENHI